MEPNNCIEYNTVVMAAFLHDIGKFLHRESVETLRKSHQLTASNFFSHSPYKEKLINESLYDMDLFCFLVKYHHDKEIESKQEFFSSSERNKTRVNNLLKIVKRSDEYSCKERDIETQEKRKGEKRLAPLDSIFAKIKISGVNRSEQPERYHQTKLVPFTCFPYSNLTKLEDKEIGGQIEAFKKNLPDFSKLTDFSELMVSWADYLQQYLWAVPSDTRYEHSDVSLFDHLKTSAAIASCLYKVHLEKLDNKINFKKTNEFFFVGGAFSGIQNYIFDITNAGTGGTAKRLRARSAFVYMFCESAIHKIVHALELPYVCTLFSTGGKFLIIAPLTPSIEEKLKKVESEIEQEIHKTYFNQFTFLMHWKEIMRFEDEFRVYKFYSVANKLFDELEAQKVHKSISVLRDLNHHWSEDAFRATTLYKSYKGEGDCKVCGKGPATYPESLQEQEILMQCSNCWVDRNVIGLKIPKCKAVAFGRQKPEEGNNNRIVLFHGSLEYYAELIENDNDLKNQASQYLVYRFKNDLPQSGNTLTHFYANHIPVDSKGNTLEFAQISSRGLNDDSPGMLGILKADIDNLGLIFNKGFENPVDEEKHLDTKDRKTISRFLTLSRMTELFFSGWLKACMEKTNHQHLIRTLESTEGLKHNKEWEAYLNSGTIDFDKIYTVYSGGDDLVLIGPWETMIIFSIILNTQFRKFTCNNPSITLSAGLTFIKPKFPVAAGILQADNLLKTSKESGKNRITLFGTTVKWDQLPKLVNFFLFFDNKLNILNSGINSGFLYRLLEYHKTALTYFEEKKVDGLKYISALNYDMGRNLIERDRNQKIIKGEEEFRRLNELTSTSSDSIMQYMKIPLFWTLYRNRYRLSQHAVSQILIVTD